MDVQGAVLALFVRPNIPIYLSTFQLKESSSYTADYGPFIERQLASHNRLQRFMWCRLGHATPPESGLDETSTLNPQPSTLTTKNTQLSNQSRTSSRTFKQKQDIKPRQDIQPKAGHQTLKPKQDIEARIPNEVWPGQPFIYQRTVGVPTPRLSTTSNTAKP